MPPKKQEEPAGPVTYWTATPFPPPELQLTTLATGNDDADIARLLDHADARDWPTVFVRKWESETSGDEKAANGKEQYRAHKQVDSTNPLVLKVR